MMAQVVLLYLLTTQLAKIQSQLKLILTSAAVASVPAAAAGEVQPQQSPRPSASSVGVKLARKPTLDNLLPDVPKKGFAPACEWELLSPPELEVAQKANGRAKCRCDSGAEWCEGMRANEHSCALIVRNAP